MIACNGVQAFGWFALGAYIVDLVYAVINYRKSGSVQRNATITATQETTTSARY